MRKRIPIPKITREIVKMMANYCCQRCGMSLKRSKLAQIHHIDRNPNNNNMENLELLCWYCHWGEHECKEDMLIFAINKELI